jgi:Mrp family chromosome partitioning ATPase
MDFLVSEGEADGNPSGAVRPDRRFNHNLVGEFYVLDPLSSLAMILGNRRANIPTDALLQGKAFHELIAEARGAFDVVVVDSAPLLPVVDPQYIAPLADAAVLCVRFGQASQMDLRTACSHLSDSLAPAAPVIAVLNALETSRQDYRYAYY